MRAFLARNLGWGWLLTDEDKLRVAQVEEALSGEAKKYRFCAQCKYAKKHGRSIDRFMKCAHPSSKNTWTTEPTKEQLVTGVTIVTTEDMFYCTTMRDSEVRNRCGDSGRYWEYGRPS